MSRLFSIAVLIYSMLLFPLIIDVVAITNLTLSLNFLQLFRYLMAATSANVTPPKKYTRIFLVLCVEEKKSFSTF